MSQGRVISAHALLPCPVPSVWSIPLVARAFMSPRSHQVFPDPSQIDRKTTVAPARNGINHKKEQAAKKGASVPPPRKRALDQKLLWLREVRAPGNIVILSPRGLTERLLYACTPISIRASPRRTFTSTKSVKKQSFLVGYQVRHTVCRLPMR